MPSYKKSHSDRKSRKDRKRYHSDDSEDECDLKRRNGKSQFKIDELLKTFQERELNNNNNQLLKFVPKPLKNMFTSYIKNLQTINNSFQSISSLFQSNEQLLNRHLLTEFEEIAEISRNKCSAFTTSLVDCLVKNCEDDSVYNSIKAACTDPVITLEKLADVKSCSAQLPLEQKNTENINLFDEFEDSDIELQIHEVFDNIEEQKNIKFNKEESCNTNEKEKSSMETFNETNKFILKRDLKNSNEDSDLLKNLQFDSDGFLVVYTDGCCFSNGREGAKAGIGVWFAPKHPLNVSAPVKGPPTNNNAEIQAATRAVIAASSINKKKIRICTDSQFLIDCMTKWIGGWKRNNWITASGKPVKNKISLQELDDVLTLMDAVEWKHIAAHRGIMGNENADILAKAGAEKYKS